MQNEKYTGRSQTLIANGDAIGDIVGRAAQELEMSESKEKVSLHDIDRINTVSLEYMRECAGAGCLPTVRGVSSRLGVSRQALYDFAKNHRGGSLDLWLKEFSDVCAELTMEAAMTGSVKEVSAIFTTKARYGWKDTFTVETPQPTGPLDNLPTPEEIAAKYAELPSD